MTFFKNQQKDTGYQKKSKLLLLLRKPKKNAFLALRKQKYNFFSDI